MLPHPCHFTRLPIPQLQDYPHLSGRSPKAKSNNSSASPDRRLNVILFGIPECPRGTDFKSRLDRDFHSVYSIMELADKDLPFATIRDCQRIGKYNTTSSRPRPILAKLNSSRHVEALVRTRSRFQLPADTAVNVTIRRDLTKDERNIESTLLRERRSLIDSGTDSSLIRLRGSRLYLNSRLYGSASQTGFHKASTRSQPSAPGNASAHTSDNTIVSATALPDPPSTDTEVSDQDSAGTSPD